MLNKESAVKESYYVVDTESGEPPIIYTEEQRQSFIDKNGESTWFTQSNSPILTASTLKEAYHIQEGWMLGKGMSSYKKR